jgi:hypothetical protein
MYHKFGYELNGEKQIDSKMVCLEIKLYCNGKNSRSACCNSCCKFKMEKLKLRRTTNYKEVYLPILKS